MEKTEQQISKHEAYMILYRYMTDGRLFDVR